MTVFGAGRLAASLVLAFWAAPHAGAAEPVPPEWRAEFPKTDFSRTSIDLTEIVTDGPRRDDIPPIDAPAFVAVSEVRGVGPMEPVLGLVIAGEARAYPLRILLWHELVNDTVGGVPVLVSYCPLCNSGVVYDRRLAGRVLRFGNTGRIRHYDMVMYDRETESWWQQFQGEAVIGELTGARLAPIPARLESLAQFAERAPAGRVLVPADPEARPYGLTPYAGFEHRVPRVLAAYDLPPGVGAVDRVVVVGDQAWPLRLVRRAGVIRAGDLVLTWRPGLNSLHDTRVIARGRDVGSVTVTRVGADGVAQDVAHDVSFAFVFRAFRPLGRIHAAPATAGTADRR